MIEIAKNFMNFGGNLSHEFEFFVDLIYMPLDLLNALLLSRF